MDFQSKFKHDSICSAVHEKKVHAKISGASKSAGR